MISLKSLRAFLASLPLFLLSARAAVVNATWASANDVPVNAASYTTTGNTVNLTLNFAPEVGTNLTVVNNTGLPFIQGTFGNLTQGQKVALTYGGIGYNFVANYYGGTGNDLVLQWANTRVVAWGDNGSGVLGDGTSTDRLLPTFVRSTGILAGKSIVAVSAGTDHNLALCSDGTLAAWGDNATGELGINSTTDSNIPVAVDQSAVLAGKTVVAISAGVGTRSAALHISSNDADESPYDISLSGTGLSSTLDTDGDGLNDAAEFQMEALGFDWQVTQAAMVNVYFANAEAGGLGNGQGLQVGAPKLSKNPTTGLFKL